MYFFSWHVCVSNDGPVIGAYYGNRSSLVAVAWFVLVVSARRKTSTITFGCFRHYVFPWPKPCLWHDVRHSAEVTVDDVFADVSATAVGNDDQRRYFALYCVLRRRTHWCSRHDGFSEPTGIQLVSTVYGQAFGGPKQTNSHGGLPGCRQLDVDGFRLLPAKQQALTVCSDA